MFKNNLEFRSYTDMIELISSTNKIFRNKYDLIIGIPRSGMLPAYILSLNLHLPITNLESFLISILPVGGVRTNLFKYENFKNILVVDDSIQFGIQNNIIRDKLSIFKNINFEYLAVYANNASKNKVDYFYELIESPRIFQWNILNSWIYEYSCVDIDGVLCNDPTEDENDDGFKYINFLKTAVPKFIPECKVGVLVTNRLEKYRKYTEEWLNYHNVKYDKLIMLDLPDKETRVRLGIHSNFKADVYSKNHSSILFIESSLSQAKKINLLSRKPVFSVEKMIYLEEINSSKINFLAKNYSKLKNMISSYKTC